MKNNSVFTYCT